MPYSIYSLTGLRGVAAIWIASHHFSESIRDRHPAIYDFPFIRNNYSVVNMFFMLSGFMLMHVNGKEFLTLSAKSYRRFAVARAARIYPLHIVVTILILAVFLATPGYREWFLASVNARSWDRYYTATGFIQTLTLTNRWLISDRGVWNPVTWSLSAELIACAFFPVLARVLASAKSATISLAFALSALVLTHLLLLLLSSPDSGGRIGLIRAVGSFSAGAFAYKFVVLGRGSAILAKWGAAGGVAAAFVAVFFERSLFLMPYCFLLIIISLSYQTGLINKALSGSFAIFLGKISYGVYLCHVPLIWFIQYFMRSLKAAPYYDLMFFSTCFVAIAATSTLLHLYVEQPAKLLIKRLGKSRHRRSTTLDSESYRPVHDHAFAQTSTNTMLEKHQAS